MKKEKKKIICIKVIEGNYGYGWEEVSSYELTGNEEEDKKIIEQAEHDLDEYNHDGYNAIYRMRKRYEVA